jgi:ubiquinol-cytochrome c reductase iron-sulfur subunit
MGTHVTPAGGPTGTPDEERRRWLLATGAAGGVAAAATAIPFTASFAPSERAKAAGGAVEVDLSTIPPGGLRTVEWRGKPVWIVHRTPQMLDALHGHDAQLVDPQSRNAGQQPPYAANTQRARQAEWFVAIGLCTHLGCSPTEVASGSGHPSLPADWPGGFFCPCHGSTFDHAGRVYRNKPAPSNLEILPHHFVGSGKLVIGEDGPAA